MQGTSLLTGRPSLITNRLPRAPIGPTNRYDGYRTRGAAGLAAYGQAQGQAVNSIYGQLLQYALAQGYQNMAERNRAREEQLYNRTLRGYRRRERDVMGTLETAGRQDLSDIRSAWRTRSAGAQQDLVGRGLANTTIAPTLAAGHQRYMQADLRRSRQGMAVTRAQTQAQMRGDRLRYQGSATFDQPDPALLANLSRGVGQSSGYYKTRRRRY